MKHIPTHHFTPPSFKILGPSIKISIITDISIFRFYRYIGYIGDISVDILKKNIDKLKIIFWKKILVSLKLLRTRENVRKTS